MADSRAANLGLWFALVFPSSFVVDKNLGRACAIAYPIIIALILTRKSRLSGRLSNRNLLWLALLTMSVIVIAFLAIYPVANTHLPGAGSLRTLLCLVHDDGVRA